MAKTINLPSFRGGPLALLKNHDHEVILSGGSDIGKTWAGCVKSYLLCSDPRRPGVHGCLVRKAYNAIETSCGRTFKLITQGMPIRRVGGVVYTDKWIFPNGSELIPVGMDKPDKMLSSEWDFVQVVQAEQLSESDWEVIASRCTGRGAKVAYPQIFGDCNPAGTKHWIRARAKSGVLTLLNSTHKDNPALYDAAGNITPEGKRRIGFLESTLTGVRRRRLLQGEWATAEGAVYDIFDSTPGGSHVINRKKEDFKRFFLAIDEGYTNPAVILLVGEDSDGRWHCFKEFYKSGVLQGDIVALAKSWFNEWKCELAAVDESAAGLIADLKSMGVHAVGGKGRVLDGIATIQNRLKVAGDGKARLSIEPDCYNFIDELESYAWRPEKDVPVKEHDHACFVAGTKVLTKRGNVPIETVTTADQVWTPLGWSSVCACGCVGEKKVKDFGIFTATPNHKILTAQGIKEIETVNEYDMVMIWRQNKRWSLTAGVMCAIRSHPIILQGITFTLLERLKEKHYTVQSGKSTTEKFLKGCTFITWILILRTITLAISLWCLLRHTKNFILTIHRWNTWRRCGKRAKHGTQQRKGNDGTQATLEGNGKTNRPSPSSVSNAEHLLRPTIMPAVFAGLSVKTECGDNKMTHPCHHTDRVFNLTTEHGCYFANGILVSNCDAIRYLADVLTTPSGAFWTTQGIGMGKSELDAGSDWDGAVGSSRLTPDMM